MQVACPVCHQRVAGTDIDLTFNRAVCRQCSEVFSLDALAPAGAMPLAAPRAVLRPAEMGWTETLPGSEGWSARVTLSRDGAWFQIGFGLFFTLVSLPFALMVVGLLHFAVGVTAIYAGLCTLLNHGEIAVESGRFRFASRPLPRRGAIDEPVETIVGFSPGRIQAGRFNLRTGNPGQWEVRMATMDGRSVPLPLPLPDERHATFLAARLNAALTAMRPASYRVAALPALEPVEAPLEPEEEEAAKRRDVR